MTYLPLVVFESNGNVGEPRRILKTRKPLRAIVENTCKCDFSWEKILNCECETDGTSMERNFVLFSGAISRIILHFNRLARIEVF